MSDVLLKVQGLKTQFGVNDSVVRAVDGVDFEIRRGETFALLGESGCGKSMTALSVMRLVPEPAGVICGGAVLLDGQDLLALTESDMRDVRGGKIGMIFQEPMTSLNPVLTVGDQIGESVLKHTSLRGKAAQTRVVELLDDVGIPDAQRRYGEYPHQLSGGMKQRVMIAMALAGEPELLIADEPTTALDVTIQAQVLELLKTLQRERNMAILLITHDLGVVAQMADEVAVMYAGQIVERANRQAFFDRALHPYSRKLFESLPDSERRDEPLATIPGTVPSLRKVFTACRFAERCTLVTDQCRSAEPAMETPDDQRWVRCFEWRSSSPDRVAGVKNNPAEYSHDELVLAVRDLKMHFPIHAGLLQRVSGQVKAVDGLDFDIYKGRTVAIVGESGCGKTTAAKAVLQLLKPTQGSVRFLGRELVGMNAAELRACRKDFQIIFQDPYSAMNPRMLVGDIIAEGLVVQNVGGDAGQRASRVAELLRQVGLPEDAVSRYPHEFSGGQRQRISIARALALNPKLIVCDEPTSALDVSVQAQILNLLQTLQRDLGLAYMFITHNISVVSYLAHEVIVMYLGRVVEQGLVGNVLENPAHPYTQALLSAVPVIDQSNDVANGREVIRLEGDMPSPAAPPVGCHFHPRCPQVMDSCKDAYPVSHSLSDGHVVRCHLYRQN